MFHAAPDDCDPTRDSHRQPDVWVAPYPPNNRNMICLPPSHLVASQFSTGPSAADAGYIRLANGFTFTIDAYNGDGFMRVIRKDDRFRVCYAGHFSNHGYMTLAQNVDDPEYVLVTTGSPRKLVSIKTPQ